MIRIQFILIVAVSLYSCSQSRKLAKARETFDENLGDAALYCVQKFPVTETTQFLPGDTIRDTIQVPVVKEVEIKCPPSVRDTIIRYKVTVAMPVVTSRITDTLKIKVKDSAQIRILSDSLAFYKLSLSKCQNKLNKSQQKVARQARTLFWFWLALVVVLLVLTRKLWMPLIGGLPAFGLKLFSSFLKLFR